MTEHTIHTPSLEYLPAGGAQFGAPAPDTVTEENLGTVSAWFIAPEASSDPAGLLARAVTGDDTCVAAAVMVGSGRGAIHVSTAAQVLGRDDSRPVEIDRETMALIGRCALRAAADDDLWKSEEKGEEK